MKIRGFEFIRTRGDRVLQRDSISALRAATKRGLNNPQVQGALLDYTHFCVNFPTEAGSHDRK